MAITVLSQPAEIAPAYTIDGSNLAIVVSSTDAANYSFRYVQRISVNGAYVTQTRVAPNIEDGFGNGVLQPNRILEDFVSRDLHRVVDFNVCEQSFAQYDVAIGEESDGTIGGTGASYSVVFGPTVSGYVWNGSFQYADDYVFQDYLAGNTAGTQVSFLTYGPTTQDIGIAESTFLYWLNGSTGMTGGPTGTYDLAMRIRVYSEDGSSDSYRVVPGFEIPAPSMCSLAVGPPDLNALVDAGLVWRFTGAQETDPIIGCTTVAYDVSLTSIVSPFLLTTPPIRYVVSCDCERYTPFRFAWLNRLGGMDSYTFRLKSTHTVSSDKKEFTRYLSRYNVATDRYDYILGNRGRKVYDVQAFDIYTVVSTWQDETTHAWLAELFTSPEAYLITTDGDGAITYDPIIVTSKSVEVRDKKGYGNRLLSHTIEFQRAYPTVIQRAS